MDIFERISKDSGGPIGQYRERADGYFAFPRLEGELGPRMTFNGREVLCWSSFYCGELTDNIFRQVKPAGGLIYRYNLSPRWALKADIIFSKVSGSDGKTNHNYERNLNFVSPISEIGVQAELNFFKLYNATGPSCDPQKSPDTPGSPEGNTEGPGTASSEPLLPS